MLIRSAVTDTKTKPNHNPNPLLEDSKSFVCIGAAMWGESILVPLFRTYAVVILGVGEMCICGSADIQLVKCG